MFSKTRHKLYQLSSNLNCYAELKVLQIVYGWRSVFDAAGAWYDLVTCTVDDSHGDVAGVYYYRFVFYLSTCNKLHIAELGIG